MIVSVPYIQRVYVISTCEDLLTIHLFDCVIAEAQELSRRRTIHNKQSNVYPNVLFIKKNLFVYNNLACLKYSKY